MKTSISRSSVFSLVAGMLFFIPVVTSLAALVMGLYALRQIRKRDGELLGKGLAVWGVALGALGSMAWGLILFGHTVYVVKPTDRAVIMQENTVKRLVGPGIHFVIPGREHLQAYNVTQIHADKTGYQKYFLYDKRPFEMDMAFSWRFCLPMAHAALLKSPNTPITQSVLQDRMRAAVINALIEKKTSDPAWLQTDDFSRAVYDEAEKLFLDYGVCLMSVAIDDQKALRFLQKGVAAE